MKAKTRKSALWNLLKIPFPEADMDASYLAFANTIWMPPGITDCPAALLVHETIHLKQQGFSVRRALVWWVKYIINKKFRYEQELEAYQVQYKWFTDTQTADFKTQYKYRTALAALLASPMYGKIVTKAEAFEALGQKTQ